MFPHVFDRRFGGSGAALFGIVTEIVVPVVFESICISPLNRRTRSRMALIPAPVLRDLTSANRSGAIPLP